MDSYLKKLDELIEDRTLSDSQVISQARTFIAELEKKIAIKDKIIKQLDDYSDNYFSFDENGDPVY
jgi:hypothetical protein